MESALHVLLTSAPQAAAIWITLLLVVAVAAMLVTAPGRRGTIGATLEGAVREPAAPSVRKPAGKRAEQPAGQAAPDDGRRYAEEIVEVAERAAVTAGRRRAEWERAQSTVDTAWAAYDEADTAARRSAAATAFPLMSRRRAKGENADRERFLHHAATAACRNRELSIGQLNDALAHRGWDARKHPVQQEAALRNAVRDHRFAAYRSATAREQQAWQVAEQAAAALRSLREEALAAKIRAGREVRSAGSQWWAEQWQSTQPSPVATA